jgi:hypothetical protein
MLEELVFKDIPFLQEVIVRSAAESLGSDSAGRNGINIELELVKSFNRAAKNKHDFRLATQRQIQELIAKREEVCLVGKRVRTKDLLEAFKQEQRFDAVDLFLFQRTGEQIDIFDWASLKTAQFIKPKKKQLESVGSYITLFNDPQGEIANYFLERETTIDPENQICKVFTLVIFRDSLGLAESFSVFKTETSPKTLKKTFPCFVDKKRLSESLENTEGDLTFVDRLEKTGKKATSFDRGVKVRYSTMLREPEGFKTLVRTCAIDSRKIEKLYLEIYSLE